MQSGESLSISFQLTGNTHIDSLYVLPKTRAIKVHDTAEPQLNKNPHEKMNEPCQKKVAKARQAGVVTLPLLSAEHGQ